MSIVFRRKVLEFHSERLYGSIAEDSSESESGSSKESSPPQQPQAVLAESDCDLEKDLSIHEQHERFMEKQIQLATGYKEKQKQLPRTISSKRSAMTKGSCEDFVLGKKAKLSSEVEKTVEQESGVQKGPRIVSRVEKNKRRKLKKKRLACKS